MSPATLLVLYCLLILIASLLGGWVPFVVRLTHRRMEVALSFVSGVMLGVGLLHLAPHAWMERAKWLATQGDEAATHDALRPVMLWLLAGFLAMFLIERFFCFHHHDAPDGEGDQHTACADHGAGSHGHTLTWSGAAVGLALHSLIAGVALAASVQAEYHGGRGGALAGLGMFLVIFLHKPFDALTIGTIMAGGTSSLRARHLVNILFSLAIPLGVVLFLVGLDLESATSHLVLSDALAFAAGAFLCVALSDLLPELQFHRHDRLKLTLALVLGLALAWGLSQVEAEPDDHGGQDGAAIGQLLTGDDR